MKNKLIILISLLFLSNFIYGQSEQENTTEAKDHIIAIGEMIGTNLLVYDFNSLILKGTQETSFNIFINNLKTPWIWDSSGFSRNQIIHPYIGLTYFNCGRSNNLNFIQSFLLSAAGSFMWETYLEGPTVSLNDFITTPTAGAVLGEITHRLSYSFYDCSKVLSFLISPVDGINELLRGKRCFNPIGNIYQIDLSINSGLINSIFSLDNMSYNNSNNFYIPSIGFDINITYENPYGHKTKEFYDQFIFRTGALGSINYGIFYLKGDGLLYSNPYYIDSKKDNKNTIGATLNYDVYKAKDILFSSSAVGFTNKNYIQCSNKTDLFFNSEINFIYLATCDNYFLLSKLIEKNKKQTEYTFKYGPQIKLNISTNNDFIGNFYINSEFNYLINYKNSSYDNKFTSNAILIILETGYEHKIKNNFYLGINDLFYFKKDINKNDEICSTNQITNFVNLYIKYRFNY